MHLCSKHEKQVSKYGYITDQSKETTRDKNKIYYENDYALLEIRNKKNEKLCDVIIDTEDVERIRQYKWRKSGTRGGMRFYSTIDNKEVLLSRFILNYDGPLVVDHINQNTLDNRKSNLRIVTNNENLLNNKSVGVYLYKGKWIVDINRYNHRFYAGKYETKEEALLARKAKCEEIDRNKDQLIKDYNDFCGEHHVGVSFRRGKWIAYHYVKGKQISDGRFKTKEEAILARKNAEKKGATV